MPEGKKLIQISCGLYHTLALEDNGIVWAWGSVTKHPAHNKGQCG